MKHILAFIHVALVSTVLMPVYEDMYGRYIPLEGALRAVAHHRWLLSVVAAGLPAFLALLNLPLILMLKGETGDRWRAFSSLILGFLSTAMMFQLVLRYGYGREWGGIVIWFDSLLLLIAGTAATARLRPVVEPAIPEPT